MSRFNCSSSASVRRSFPAHSFGRSVGVMWLLAHTPEKSGCPSAVLGGVYLPVSAFGAAFWAATLTPASAPASATAIKQLRIFSSFDSERGFQNSVAANDTRDVGSGVSRIVAPAL